MSNQLHLHRRLLPVLYFAELEILDSKHERLFFIRAQRNKSWVLLGGLDYLKTDVVSRNAPYPFVSPLENYITLRAANATAVRQLFNNNSTILPPFINAAELFTPISTANIGTDAQDGNYGIILILYIPRKILDLNHLKKISIRIQIILYLGKEQPTSSSLCTYVCSSISYL